MVGLLLLGGLMAMSISWLYLHQKQQPQLAHAAEEETGNAEQNYIVFDDADLPEWENDAWLDNEEDSAQTRHDMILSFTRIYGKCEKQLPIIGLPDKALYNIH